MALLSVYLAYASCLHIYSIMCRMTRAVERKAITAPRAMAENKKQMWYAHQHNCII
jgi:hypothetical protein